MICFMMNILNNIEPVEKSIPQTCSRDLATFPESVRAEVAFRSTYLNWIVKHLDGKWTQSNLEPLILKAAAEFEGKTPSWRTVRRWWDSFT
jgi:putative transposase